MYEIILLNQYGKRFSKTFASEYLFKKFYNKAKRSKKIKVISYGRNMERY